MKIIRSALILLTPLFFCATVAARPKIDEVAAIEKTKSYLDEQVSWTSQAKYVAVHNRRIWFVTVKCENCVDSNGKSFSIEYSGFHSSEVQIGHWSLVICTANDQ
jgi:hypothetical protein